MNFISKFSALLLLCPTLVSAQEPVPMPEVNIPDEAKYDSPIPPLPEAMRPLTAEEQAKIDEEFAKNNELPALVQATQDQLNANLDEAEKASAKMSEFKAANNISDTAAESPAALEPFPLKIEPTPKDTIIEWQGGAFLDMTKNMAVCSKDVKIRGPQVNLDCTDQLQVYFKEDPEKAKKAEAAKNDEKNADNPFAGVGVNFGGVEKMVAFGNVYVEFKDKDGVWWQAHAERITYNEIPGSNSKGITGDVILSGGYPYIRQKGEGGSTFRSTKESDTIRYIDGKVIHTGPATGKMDIDKLSDKNKKPKN